MGGEHTPEQPRWAVTINYLTASGVLDVRHEVEEIEDVHGLVERGPDWNAIDSIVITLQRTTGRLTVEQAEAE